MKQNRTFCFFPLEPDYQESIDAVEGDGWEIGEWRSILGVMISADCTRIVPEEHDELTVLSKKVVLP